MSGQRIALALATVAASLVAGCGGGSEVPILHPGSTLADAIVDVNGDGVLEPGPGEALIARTELGAAAPVARTLLTLAQISDPHIVDEESPLRVEVVDRVGGRVTSAFRPQEVLTTQVLEATVQSVNRLGPDAVLVTGDIVDNNQENELRWATQVLRGGDVHPDSGGIGYEGVQEADRGDPFFYRPDLDAPRHVGLLSRAQDAFHATGLRAPWFPAVSNHDVLIEGVVPADPILRREAVGPRKLETPSDAARSAASDGIPDRARLEALITGGDVGRFRQVSADVARRPVGSTEAVRIVADAAGVPTRSGYLVYERELAKGIRLLVLDTANRTGGADGLLPTWQVEWLKQTLKNHAGDRFLIVAPTPLEATTDGDQALKVLDETPGVVAVLSGDTHRNLITPRPGRSGGYWLVRAPSLVDYPQQARALRLVELTDGRVALQTWLLDHAGVATTPGVLGLAGISRDLAFLDTQGGRPRRWTGTASDRNTVLYLPS